MADVDLGDGRYAYAVRRRPVMQDIYEDVVIDDDLGIYPIAAVIGSVQVGWEPDVPPGFPGSALVYDRTAEGVLFVRTTGPSRRRGQWLVVLTVEAAGASFDTATYPADHPRITQPVADPFGPQGPSTDYVSAGDPWDFFDVTSWAINGASLPGRIKGIGS